MGLFHSKFYDPKYDDGYTYCLLMDTGFDVGYIYTGDYETCNDIFNCMIGNRWRNAPKRFGFLIRRGYTGETVKKYEPYVDDMRI